MTHWPTYSGWGMALCLGIGLALPVQAQPSTAPDATTYFHEAAQEYVDSNLQQALATVNQGLRIAPDDPQLRALRDAIQQKRQRSGGGSGGQEDNPQSGQNSPNANSQSNNDARGQDSDAEQSNRSPSQPSDPSQGQGGQGGNTSDDDPRRAAEEGSGTQSRPNEGETSASGLSQAQAARILRALETQEKQLLRQVLKRDRRPQRILKEW